MTRKFRVRNIVILAASFVGAAAFLIGTVPHAGAVSSSVTQFSEDCGDCEEWPGYGPPEHYFSSHHTFDGSHDCEPDGCHLGTEDSSCVIHPKCFPPTIPEAVAALVLDPETLMILVENDAGTEIRKRIGLAPTFLKVNSERSALQIMDCSGENVAVHIPVDESLLQALESN